MLKTIGALLALGLNPKSPAARSLTEAIVIEKIQKAATPESADIDEQPLVILGQGDYERKIFG